MAIEKPEPIQLKTGPAEDVERVHLFTIDGTEYYARTNVPFNVTLRANRIYAERGEQAAEAYTLVQVLGQEGYEALENFDELTEDQFVSILDYAEKVVKGPGKQPNRETRRAASPRGGKTRSSSR
jgi:hypothetical protein